MAVAWGSKTASTQLTSITSEQFFSQTPQLAANEEAHVEVIANFPATPTDDALVSVYGTLDDSTEDWDDTPLFQFTISKDTDPNKVSFVVSSVYKFRVGIQRDGSTDTITDADMNHRIATRS